MAFKFSSLRDYSTVIDVRSESEYAHDHIPGAINLPVLTDAQRHEVGTAHKNDTFAARRLGMGYVAGNIAKFAASELAGKDRRWMPLLYCWRGGMRSESFALVLRKVGWRADVIEGGYKAYRRHVLETLEELPAVLDWRVLCGPTGSGKTLLLSRLAKIGEQCLDLEGIANHRGSLFGMMGKQPSQKTFEGFLCERLLAMDHRKPVYVESESAMIGRLRMPKELMHCIRTGKIVDVQVDLGARARLTAKDYVGYNEPSLFSSTTKKLEKFVGSKMVLNWNRMLCEKKYVELAHSMLKNHYDPRYARSYRRSYGAGRPVCTVRLDPNDEGSIKKAVSTLLAA